MLFCCSGVSLLYKGDDLLSFLYSSGLCICVGLFLLVIGKGAERYLRRRDGYVIVTVAWLAFSIFGMLPFYLSGYIPSITNAFFETMSGFSSTGASILDDIERLPHGLLFWRSMTQWIGGLGIVFFTIATNQLSIANLIFLHLIFAVQYLLPFQQVLLFLLLCFQMRPVFLPQTN